MTAAMTGLKTERWIKENVEAIAIAIVMALVIRQFAIEAFKIPTESMSPTLYGDTHGGGTGDRILVYKVPYLLDGPSRWDVVVFKYPLNTSKNYIKRLIGMPGETLEITADGDILVDGKIARKPPHVQRVLYREIFPGKLGPQSLRHAWELSGPEWTRPAADALRVEAATETASCQYGRNIVCPDARLRMEVAPGAGSEVYVLLQEHGVKFELVLAVDEGESYLMADGTKHPVPDVVLPSGRATDVMMSNVDDVIEIEVDGRTFRHEYESIRDRAGKSLVQFGVRRGTADFTGIRLDRDINYVRESPGRWEIPEDRYFMLGDNTTNSQDSRRWRLRRVTLNDGRVCEYEDTVQDDVSQRPEVGEGEVTKMDRDGIWRVWKTADVENATTFSSPFVPRVKHVGRAFFVFWPLNPLTDQFRLKFIR